MNIVPLLAPLFLVFEAWQLFMGERYVGIKQIARGADPREMGPGEAVSFFWSACIFLYMIWTFSLFAFPPARVYALFIVATTAIGYPIRRNCGLKWVLVVLTCEGSARIGFLAALSVVAWRHQ